MDCWTGDGLLRLAQRNWMVNAHTNAKSTGPNLVSVPFLSRPLNPATSAVRVILPKARETRRTAQQNLSHTKSKCETGLYPSCKICTQVPFLTRAQYARMDFRETVVRAKSDLHACAAHWRKTRGSSLFDPMAALSVPKKVGGGNACFLPVVQPSRARTADCRWLALSLARCSPRDQSICAAAIHPNGSIAPIIFARQSELAFGFLAAIHHVMREERVEKLEQQSHNI